MAICDRGGLPIAVHVASASPYEPHLVPATLDARFLPDLPWCLIGDRGYDSDGLDDLLMTQYGIEMIAANRRGRAKTKEGRELRRAKRRWKIERLFAWLHNCRRVVTRWERHVGNYLGMVQLACARILLRAFMRQLLGSHEGGANAVTQIGPCAARQHKGTRRAGPCGALRYLASPFHW